MGDPKTVATTEKAVLEMHTSSNLSASIDILLSAPLTQQRTEKQDSALSSVLSSMLHDPTQVIGPLCEGMSAAKHSRRKQFMSLLCLLREKLPQRFDVGVTACLSCDASRHRQLGAAFFIKANAIIGIAEVALPLLEQIVCGFESSGPTHYEGELYNTCVFCAVALNVVSSVCVSFFVRWAGCSSPVAASAARFIHEPSELSAIRLDLPFNPDRASRLAKAVRAEKVDGWVEFGLSLATASDANQVSSAVACEELVGQTLLALIVQEPVVHEIGRALFHHVLYRNKLSEFDPLTLGSVLSERDGCSDMAVAFFAEVVIKHPDKCLGQVVPLLRDQKVNARRNALSLLQRVLNANPPLDVRRVVAHNLLPMISDEELSVRLDLPALFASLPPSFITNSLVKAIGSRDDRQRSAADACLKRLLDKAQDPLEVIRLVLDAALATPEDDERTARYAFDSLKGWSSDHSLALDPLPFLRRLWDEPGNVRIVRFFKSCAGLIDKSRLAWELACRIREVDKPNAALLDRLAPLLVLGPVEEGWFGSREALGSGILELLFTGRTLDAEDQRALRQLRCELIGRFPAHRVVPLLNEVGLFCKFSLAVLCFEGLVHPGDQALVAPRVSLEGAFEEVDQDLLLPVSDCLGCLDRARAMSFALNGEGTAGRRLFLLVVVLKHPACADGDFKLIDRLLALPFQEADAPIAMEALFLGIYKSPPDRPEFGRALEISLTWFYHGSQTQTRLAAVKCIAALFARSAWLAATELTRFQGVAETAAADSDPQIAAIGAELVKCSRLDRLIAAGES